jgi:SAM-dependent methyltransferase
MHVTSFYNDLSPFYHLIYTDWEGSVKKQGRQLDAVIRSEWSPQHRRVLDAACGIGTQTLGLAELGYDVAASDLSEQAVERARGEADERGLNLDFRVADMRSVHDAHDGGFDIVIACDNALPHLLSDEDILQALRAFHDCLRPGGGCVITTRDYENEPNGRGPDGGLALRPTGIRKDERAVYTAWQVWDFEGDVYTMSLYLTEDTGEDRPETRVFRTRYYSIPTGRTMELMRRAGFRHVRRLDDAFFQPLMVGTKKAE